MKPQPDASSLHARACWMSDFEREDKPPEEVTSALALVERVAAGDPIAFEQIVLENERRVLTLAWRLLGQMDAAQDAAQEVFLRAFKYLHRLDTKRPVASWLMGITVNVCRDLGRKRQASLKTFSTIESLQGESTPVDQAKNPHDQLVSHQHQEMLWAALEQLPNRERAAIVLRDIEGLSTQEVADVLKSSPSTVRTQISSARLKVRMAIDRMKGTEP